MSPQPTPWSGMWSSSTREISLSTSLWVCTPTSTCLPWRTWSSRAPSPARRLPIDSPALRERRPGTYPTSNFNFVSLVNAKPTLLVMSSLSPAPSTPSSRALLAPLPSLTLAREQSPPWRARDTPIASSGVLSATRLWDTTSSSALSPYPYRPLPSRSENSKKPR